MRRARKPISRSFLLPLREKVPDGRMRGSLHIRDHGENPSSVSRYARSTFSLKGRRDADCKARVGGL